MFSGICAAKVAVCLFRPTQRRSPTCIATNRERWGLSLVCEGSIQLRRPILAGRLRVALTPLDALGSRPSTTLDRADSESELFLRAVRTCQPLTNLYIVVECRCLGIVWVSGREVPLNRSAAKLCAEVTGSLACFVSLGGN